MERLPVREYEDHDCAVESCSILTGLPYSVVHQCFRKHGREDNSATPWDIIEEVYKDLRFPLTERIEFDPAPTVNRLLREKLLPQGRWLVYITGHVFAVVDNETSDWSKGSRYRVREAFRVQ